MEECEEGPMTWLTSNEESKCEVKEPEIIPASVAERALVIGGDGRRSPVSTAGAEAEGGGPAEGGREMLGDAIQVDAGVPFGVSSAFLLSGQSFARCPTLWHHLHRKGTPS